MPKYADDAERDAEKALDDWARWMLASDYPAASVADPAKWSGIPGTAMRDSMVERAAIRFYNAQVRIVHEVVTQGLSAQHRKFVACYYLTPASKEPTPYTRHEMRLSERKFYELRSDVIMLVAMALRLRVPEMACDC